MIRMQRQNKTRSQLGDTSSISQNSNLANYCEVHVLSMWEEAGVAGEALHSEAQD